MTLEIVRVVGESFDLRNGQENPKSLVVSNGYQEVLVPVSDEQLAIILQLWGEGMAPGPPPATNGQQFEPKVVESQETEFPDVSNYLPEGEPTTVRDQEPSVVVRQTFEAQEEEVPEPGEVYNDALTGAQSI